MQNKPVFNDLVEKHIGKVGQQLVTWKTQRFHVFKIDSIRNISLFCWSRELPRRSPICFFLVEIVVWFAKNQRDSPALLINETILLVVVITHIFHFFPFLMRSFDFLRLFTRSTIQREEYFHCFWVESSPGSISRRFCPLLHLMHENNQLTWLCYEVASIPHPSHELYCIR